MKKLTLFFLLFSAFLLNAQLDSLSHLEYDVKLNDIWGYEDKEGNEYALVGLINGLSIVDITNPKFPREVYRSEGPLSKWRDIKVYNDFAYVTNEEDSGVRIYDISGLPNHSLISYQNYMGEFGQEFTKAHNLFIDSNGIAYIVGTNREQDMILYDLKTDPWQPKEVGAFNNNYIHDIYVRDDTAYASAISDGVIQILDVTNKESIEIISSHKTGYSQTHNAWLSDDGKYLFTTDEIDGAPIEVFDVSDKFDPEKVETYQVRQFGDEMAHNVFLKDSFLFVSYYKTGLVVVDCSKPDVLVESSIFDTDKSSNGGGADGAWGVYPYLNSGNILVSDINNGLYVLGYNPTNSGYLKGTVVDSITGFPLNEVKVEVLGKEKFDNTSFTGKYSLGIKKGGPIKVVFSLFGYISDTVNVDLIEDLVLQRDISLKKQKAGELLVTISKMDGSFIDSAIVSIHQDEIIKEYFTNSLGEVEIEDLPIGEYDVFVGKWGFKNACEFISVSPDENKLNMSLEAGYQDDFSANQGWTVTAVEGDVIWSRLEPKASFDNNSGLQYDPAEDASVDGCNGYAFCTGINSHKSSSGSTVNYTNYLVSPEVSIPNGFIDAYISLKRWVALQKNSEDSLMLGLILGNDTNYLLSVNNNQREWIESSFNLSDANVSYKTFKFIAKISDDLDPWNLVDAAIDDFEIKFISGEESFAKCIYAENGLWRSLCGMKEYVVLNSLGQIVLKGISTEFNLSELSAGIYILELEGYKPQKILVDE